MSDPRPPHAAGTRPHPLLGVLLIAGATLAFALMDNSIRLLGRRLPVILLFWARYAFQAVAMGLWLALRHRRAGFATANPRFQGLRGLLLMPFSYLQIGFATLIGAAMFGARPDGWSLAGMAVVAGSGAWAAWLNARGAAAGRA